MGMSRFEIGITGKALGMLVLAVSLSSCETVGEGLQKNRPEISPDPHTNTIAQEDFEKNRVGVLAPQSLEAGECGLFLWLRSSDRDLIFFSGPNSTARMMINGQEVTIPRVSAEGAQILAQFERQIFQNDRNTVHLEMRFERRAGMTRGVVVPQGSVRLIDEDGWEMVMPVGGLVACEEG